MSGKGWTVKELKHVDPERGSPWLARAWDPNAKKYRNQRHKTYGEAETWAKDESARLRVGISQAGKAPVQDVIDDYLADITSMGAAPGYIAEQKRTLDSAVAAGLTDLRHPRVEKIARDWLDKATALHRSVEKEMVDQHGKPIVDIQTRSPVKVKVPAPLSPRTRNRYLETLRTLANFAIKQGRIVRNPFLAISAAAQSDTLKDVFTVSEMHKLVDRDNSSHEYWLLFCTLIYTGMRLGEALHLRWDSIEWRASRIVVRDWRAVKGANPEFRLKFKKERVIPLQPEFHAILKKIAKVGKAGWVFPDDLRLASTKSHAGRLAAYLKHCDVPQVGVTGKRTPHSTRHTYLSLMLATGENELAVMLYAGHNELSTTRGYTRTQVLYRNDVKGWERGEFRLAKAKSKVAPSTKQAAKASG